MSTGKHAPLRSERTPRVDRPGIAHRVQFYEDDGFLVDDVVRFIGSGLGAGEAGVVIATAAHRDALEERLRANGVDVAIARANGRYVALDASETLAQITVDGCPDEARLAAVVGGAIERAAAAAGEHGTVRAFGEMVALLWLDGKDDAAIELERLWNRLTQKLPFSLLCAYPMRGFHDATHGSRFLNVCAEHSRVIPAESYTALHSEDQRLRMISELQQKATALEGETAQRKEAQDTARARHRTLQALVEASPVPIVVIDPDTTVRLWNPAAERVFGWTEPEVIGRPIPIVPPDKLGECAYVRDAVIRGERFHAVETYRTRRDGRSVDLLISAAPLTDAGGVVREIVLLFEDVTERNRAEAARQKALAELKTLYDMGRVLSAELDLERLLQALTDAATQLSGAEFGAFFYNASDQGGSHYPLYTLSGMPREAFEKLGMPRATTLFGPTFAGEGVIRIDDVKHDPRYGTNAPPHAMPAADLPVTSYLAVPVVGRKGEVFGGLFLGHPEPAVFTEDAERVVVGLAAQAAIAIDNARLYEAERTARAEAEAANHAKDEFLAMLGHELRNPLSAVRNAVATARLDESRRERALEIARRQADHLGRLVDDLLDVARITQRRVNLHTQRLRLASVVERAVETTRPLIDERAHVITVTLPRVDVHVEGDATRLEQVVVNLLTNAAKYSEPGGHIEVTAEREGSDVVLRVRDDGIGMAPEVLSRVFDLFAQADRTLDRAQGGLGIGLTVVRRLVELHGGKVEAHSAGLGKGAEFVVRLPAAAQSAEELPDSAASDGIRQGMARVLVVEDNPDAAETMMMLMELLGHRVRVAHDGFVALEMAQANPPDVMLVDIGLPGINGYEVARRVRQHAALKQVVLVALTGYGREEDREEALLAGFDYHLVKPVEVGALQALVDQLAAPASAPHPTLN